MLSLSPLIATGLILYFPLSQGYLIQTIWLALNILDSLRALRTIRPNGRRIGIMTRRKALRDNLVCWIVFVAAHYVGTVPNKLLGWISLYSVVETIICGVFLSSRIASSATVYNSFIVPFLRKYETPIDLALLLFQSLFILIGHYLFQLPILTAWRTATSLASAFIRLLTSSMVRESCAAVVQNQDADVDPDAVIEVISPRTSPRSALRHPAERPRGPRTSRNSPETLRRTVARPPSVIVISDTDDDLTCPSTPPRGAGSTNDWLRLPTPPPTLRRSPRREPQASRADSNFPMASNGPISAPQAVPSRATKGETSSASSAQPTPASSFMTRPASRSGPSVRSANLPGRLEYPVQVTGKQNGKAVDSTATDQPPVETIAPIKTAKEKSLGRSGITYARSSASRASSNTIVNPLTARATAGSRRLNILRATGHTAPAGTSTATVPVSLYPRLPSPLPILVTSTNVGTSRKAQINETRETTIRSVIPSRDEKAEKVGEKRRAVSGVDGEKRPGKRGRVEVRSDG